MDEHETLATIARIQQDFEEQTGPFADVEFPEERLLRELPHHMKEGKMRIISMFATFDYNRDANRLVDNIIELWDRDPYKFTPSSVPLVECENELEEILADIGFRYPSRDAHAWCKNNSIICSEYSGAWTDFLLETRLDAEALVERLNEDDFNCLKGRKIAPMYARIINDEVVELDNLWKLDIPVDVHVRRLSTDLFARFEGDDSTDDEIRKIWRLYGQREGVKRHVVDGALWFIGNQWNEWGEEYWNKVTE